MLVSGEARWARDWWQSYWDDEWLLTQRRPWLTFRSMPLIERFLDERERPRVFEFGSGASTLFWSTRGAEVTSVEHDPVWHDRIRRLLPPDVDYRLVVPELIGTTGSPADPEAYRSDDAAFEGFSFERYARQIDSAPDLGLDIVLVDGRARPSCIQQALPKVASGGLLILDNADRSYYVQHVTGLDEFRQHVFSGQHPGLPSPGRTDVYVRR
jgi:hypothetical protein